MILIILAIVIVILIVIVINKHVNSIETRLESSKSDLILNSNKPIELDIYDSETTMVKVDVRRFDNPKYYVSMSSSMYDRLRSARLNEEKYLYINQKTLSGIENKYRKLVDDENRLHYCASMNNKGISLEKEDRIEEAIEIYEKNIIDGYPATHSYHRLMVIYRRKKMYSEEIRVIEKAIEVFIVENKNSYKRSMNNNENKLLTDDIKYGHETNTTVRNKSGWVIYNPYPVVKWNNRLKKANILNTKK